MQLKRVGLVAQNPVDPRIVFRQRVERSVEAFEVNLISRDELCSDLFDCFIHASVKDRVDWGAGLDILPREIVLDLLAYVRARPEPRLFHPLPDDRHQRAELERNTLAVQADLIARLVEKLR